LIIQSLSLQNFRNYREKTFNFSRQTILLVGPNASGKTNILEAICLLAWGKSFRADLDRQMISDGETLARVKAKVAQDAFLNKLQLTDLEVILTNGEVQGKKTASKIFKVNGVGRRWRDFVGHLKVVLFRPEDIEIILGSPSIRRVYLDSVLSQVDSLYRQCHLVYDKGLRQRNRLLEKIRKGEAQPNQLEYWNRLLLKNGEIISRKREEMLAKFNLQFAIFNKNLTIEYRKNAISPERLKKYQEAELILAATLVGPHRDEVKFRLKKAKMTKSDDLSLFGSRGEQRMAILALKMAELAFIEQKSGEKPLLLLDDIFSELDEDHRAEVLVLIKRLPTIITATEASLVPKEFLAKMELIEIKS